jgi:hypothetical protein
VRARLVRQRRELHHGGKRANARRDLSHAQGCISHKSRARFRRELPSAELVSRPENEVTTNRGSFRSRGALFITSDPARVPERRASRFFRHRRARCGDRTTPNAHAGHVEARTHRPPRLGAPTRARVRRLVAASED